MRRFRRLVVRRVVPVGVAVVAVALVMVTAPETPSRIDWPETIEQTSPTVTGGGAALPPDIVEAPDPTTSSTEVAVAEPSTTTTTAIPAPTTSTAPATTAPVAPADVPPPPESVSLVDRCWAAIRSSGLSAPPGWSVHCEGPDRQRDGWCSPGTRSLHVAPDPEDSHWHIERVFAHEIGHAVHIDYVTEDEWQRWAAARGFTYPADLAAMMEDFADAFACYVGWCAGFVLPPADAALLRQLMDSPVAS
jgi:hypothetical protein